MELVAMVREMLRGVWSRTGSHDERGFRGMLRGVWSGTGGHGERDFRCDVEMCVE